MLFLSFLHKADKFNVCFVLEATQPSLFGGDGLYETLQVVPCYVNLKSNCKGIHFSGKWLMQIRGRALQCEHRVSDGFRFGEIDPSARLSLICCTVHVTWGEHQYGSSHSSQN
jgi:hypothetical protein